MASLREGQRISNYLLEARVGAGSFGEVWRARHHVFGEKVAIKVPTDPQYVRNLQREGVAVHGLKHPNIVRAIDLDPYGDPPYLVMEYIDGPSLREAIDSLRATFPIESAVRIMRGVLHALAAAHAGGLIHRDIKPANILLHHPLAELASISEPAVRVTDFGLGYASGLTTQSIQQSGSLSAEDGQRLAGTLAYMSPEQREGRELDARSDLYACGIVLFEMLTGERPQGTDLPGSLREGLPKHLDTVFSRCYTRIDRRFASAAEMMDALVLPGDARGHRLDIPPAVPIRPPLPPFAGRSLAGKCPGCQAAVQREDNFCIHCGRQLVAAVPRCRSCGEYVQTVDRFCIRCGKSLTVLT